MRELDQKERLLLFLCRQYVSAERIDYEQNINDQNAIELKNISQTITLHHLDLVAHRVLSSAAANHNFGGLVDMLAKRHMPHVKNNLKLVAESKRVIRSFTEQGVTAVTYKGFAFAFSFYGSLNERTSRDIDLAVHLSDMPACAEVMNSLGYVPAKQVDTESRKLRNSRAYYLDYPWNFYNAQGKLVYNVDIHWKPSHHALFSKLEFDRSMLASPLVLDQLGKVPTFNLVHHALVVIFHHGVLDGWGKLYQLIDLIKINQTLSKGEMNKFHGLLTKYGSVRSYNLGIALISKIFNLDFAYVGKKKENGKFIDQYMRDVLSGSLAVNWSENAKKFKYYLHTRDGLLDKLMSISQFSKFYLARSFGGWKEERSIESHE